MKFWIQLLLLTVIDFLIIWLWVKKVDPSPSVSIGLSLLVPIVIIVNLVIASILYFTKRQYASLFVVNIIPSAMLMYYLFIAGINRHQQQRYEGWRFKIEDTTFKITHSALDSTFFIDYSTKPGSSSVFLEGKYFNNKDRYLLATDTTKYIIKNNYLFNFRGDSIKLTKVDY